MCSNLDSILLLRLGTFLIQLVDRDRDTDEGTCPCVCPEAMSYFLPFMGFSHMISHSHRKFRKCVLVLCTARQEIGFDMTRYLDKIIKLAETKTN